MCHEAYLFLKSCQQCVMELNYFLKGVTAARCQQCVMELTYFLKGVTAARCQQCVMELTYFLKGVTAARYGSRTLSLVLYSLQHSIRIYLISVILIYVYLGTQHCQGFSWILPPFTRTWS